ncbi:MAG: ABC transporter permease [Phycisphaerales bacterium]|nr:ABC transporter permease [Phycisphaerales bacterium]
MGSEILGIVFRRVLVAIPLMLLVSVLVFVVLRLIPADPLAMAVPPNATKADIEAMRQEMGLNLPIMEQYVRWLGQILSGNFGRSIAFGQPVLTLIGQSLPATIELAFLSAILATIIGIPGGLLMYYLRVAIGEQLTDLSSTYTMSILRFLWRLFLAICEQISDFLSTLMMSIPEFLWGLFLILIVGVSLDLLPFAGRLDPGHAVPKATGFLLLDSLLAGQLGAFVDGLVHMILPCLALALGTAPLIMRILRSSLLEVSHEDYITMARLRGLSERQILLKHAFKNAFLPTLTLMGVQFGFLFGGTLLVEVIFSYPGLGNLMVEAVRNTDLPIIQGAALVFALAVLTINLIVDVLYIVVNPKLRRAR